MKINIAAKLIIIMLITAMVPLFIVGYMGLSTIMSMIDISTAANQQIAEVAMSDSTEALSDEQEIYLKSVVDNVAGDINGILGRVEADTEQLADSATFLYNHADRFGPYPYPSVYEADPELKMFGSVEQNDNSWMAIFSSATNPDGTVSDETLAEIYLTEYLDPRFRSIAKNNPYAVQLYLNTSSQMSRGMPFIDGEYLWVNGIEQFSDAPDVTAFDFYYLADETHNPERTAVWTELYWDPAGLGWMVSSVAPVYRTDELMGVVGIDITLGKMIDQVINVQIEDSGFAFLMSGSGQAIAFPERGTEFLGFEDSFEGDFGDNEQFSHNLTKTNDEAFQTIVANMLAGQYDLTTYSHPDTGQEYFFAYHPVEQTGWSVGIVVPIEEVIAPALATNEKILSNTATTVENIAAQSRQLIITFGAILAVIVIILMGVATVFARTISNPIKELEQGSRRIGEGDFSYRIRVNSGDELEELAETYNQMAAELQTKVEEIETANTELRKLDELKSQFISMASHELRTPLIAIQGYVDLMRDEGVQNPAEQQKMLETISRNTHRLARIVTELLDISKIEENKLVLRRAPVSITEIIYEVADELQPSLDKRGHTLTLEVAANLPDVYGDRDRIAQVVINLLGNSIKYTPDGGKIRVVARQSGDTMQISVIDNGIGIKAEDVDRLFKRFATVGDVTKHRTGKDEFMAGGTGLGLSIIKGIVEAHKGEVWVESEFGVGSTFHVTLPLVSGPDDQTTGAEAGMTYQATHFEQPTDEVRSIQTPGRLKILIVDDEKDILEVTERVLDDMYEIVTAQTGATGLKAAMTDKPDLILLDVWMPGISGFDVCRTLKRNPKTKDTPVIIFTAATEPVHKDTAREVGADGFITKPFKKETLVNLIESFRATNAEPVANNGTD
jgi:two-component system sensor histidine kinase ChiS